VDDYRGIIESGIRFIQYRIVENDKTIILNLLKYRGKSSKKYFASFMIGFIKLLQTYPAIIMAITASKIVTSTIYVNPNTFLFT
jgi:hypothetical protein